MAKRFLDKNGLDALWGLIKAAVNTLLEKVDGKANKNHTHSYIGGHQDTTQVEADGNNVIVKDSNGIQVFKTLNKFGKDDVDYPDEIGVEFRTADATEVENKESHSLGIISNKRIKLGGNGEVKKVQIGIDGNKGFTSDQDHTTIKDNNLNYLDIDKDRAKVNHKSKVIIGINSADVVKVDGTETVLKNAQTQSMGLRLKADQSELKFSGKGLTVTKTETKVTSAGKVELLAPSIEARDSKDNPIFSTERKFKSGTTTDEQQTIIFVGDKEYRTGDGTSAEIVLNGDMELYTTLQSLQSGKRSRFEMPMTIDWIMQNKQQQQLLSKEMCKYLYSAIYRYVKLSINSDDFEEKDEASLMLRQLSGENIYPVILSKYWFDGYAQAAHAQHFKPWLVEFYDEIQSYDSEEGIVSVSFIRIHIGEDFSRWLIKGLRYNELDAEMTITHMQCVIGEATEESVANITPEAVNFIVYATRGEEKDLEVGHFNLRTQL